MILFFSDPCVGEPCKGKNTVCFSTSSSKFECLCREHYHEINGSSQDYGCNQKDDIVTPSKECGPNSNLLASGSCLCSQNYFEETSGDAETQKGCKSKEPFMLFNFLIIFYLFRSL